MKADIKHDVVRCGHCVVRSDRDNEGAEMIRLDEVERAIEDIAAGRPVVVVDDADRENEGDIVFAAASATTQLMAFAVRHSSGVICVPAEGDWLDKLHVPLMVADNRDSMGTAFTVSVDATAGVTTGISAADRARTARVLADPNSVVTDVRRPGHVFALRCRAGGVMTRRGHTEATVDLLKLAGLAPVGVLVELINDDGTMKRGNQLREFADLHGIAMISIDSLVRYRRRRESLVSRCVVTRLPTPHGTFNAVGFSDEIDGAEHLAIVCGDIDGRAAVPVWVHPECALGDLFGSSACSCSSSLNAALETIAMEGLGVVVYVRQGPGVHRSYGTSNREPLASEVEMLGVRTCPTKMPRSAEAAAQILRDLGVISVQSRGSVPELATVLRAEGVEVVDDVAERADLFDDIVAAPSL
ncbi:3,4-dihydroxy-2-butanone-4-phosphate synthase [Rhodococcus opacus]|uniref:3,4-dihydroxy-2-butanone 4-phosphate synthase n=1 Tax=Rhodococcus opacus TaxID=37919 RepID=A0AAX3YUR3_RHOOP|nr:3,4-dihydroxy-2-butanone-4-phosphate synthase [Rhodococcus opacus]MCZ4590645.1 3,4-dihydroxy-2-butanone-4-phosphate synthase [Rhodococcus opacus]WLF52214.1 3,4-dihydroxy-2-butanone-4-phosphate synthase [Rhodococcus opacus]